MEWISALEKSSKFLIGCRGHWNVIAGHRITLSGILQIFRERTLTPKILKNSMLLMVNIYTSVNFFRIFWTNCHFLTSKTCFSAFLFFQARKSSKNSEKIHRGIYWIYFLSLYMCYILYTSIWIEIFVLERKKNLEKLTKILLLEGWLYSPSIIPHVKIYSTRFLGGNTN